MGGIFNDYEKRLKNELTKQIFKIEQKNDQEAEAEHYEYTPAPVIRSDQSGKISGDLDALKSIRKCDPEENALILKI